MNPHGADEARAAAKAVIELVAADLKRTQADLADRLTISTERQARLERFRFTVDVDEFGMFFCTAPDEPGTMDAEELVWQFQEGLIELLAANSLPVVWPRCVPGHPHPMFPVESNGVPYWKCPSSDATQMPVGHLGR